MSNALYGLHPETCRPRDRRPARARDYRRDNRGAPQSDTETGLYANCGKAVTTLLLRTAGHPQVSKLTQSYQSYRDRLHPLT
jgi:hypothetical protein